MPTQSVTRLSWGMAAEREPPVWPYILSFIGTWEGWGSRWRYAGQGYDPCRNVAYHYHGTGCRERGKWQIIMLLCARSDWGVCIQRPAVATIGKLYKSFVTEVKGPWRFEAYGMHRAGYHWIASGGCGGVLQQYRRFNWLWWLVEHSCWCRLIWHGTWCVHLADGAFFSHQILFLTWLWWFSASCCQ